MYYFANWKTFLINEPTSKMTFIKGLLQILPFNPQHYVVSSIFTDEETKMERL